MFDYIINIFKSTKRRFTIIGVSIILLLSFFAVFSDYWLLKRFNLVYEWMIVKRRIEEKLLIQDSLKNEISLRINDTLSIERIAREKYGMLKRGEQIYILPKYRNNK